MIPHAECHEASSPSPAPAGAAPIPSLHLQLPWHCFYWSVIDVSTVPKRSRRTGTLPNPVLLDDLFQAELPVPIEDLAAAYAPMEANNVIACALPLPRLTQALADHPALLSLTPAELPPLLQSLLQPHDSTFAPEALNILINGHEPSAVRLLRQSGRRRIFAFAAAALALASIGALRRAHDAESQTALLSSATRQAASDVTGTDSTLDESLRSLERERDRLILTRTAQAARALPADVARSMQTVLSIWPNDLEVRTQTFSANEQSIKLAVEVNDHPAAETLTKALGSLADWTLQSQRTHASGSAIRFDATLQPKGAAR